MTAAKKPQDHKPKVEKVTIDLPDGVDDDGKPKTRQASARRTTIDGITVTVTDESLDDFELLDDLLQMEKQNIARLPSIAQRLFGDDYPTVMDGLRDKNGRVSIERASSFIRDVFGVLNPN